jgi:hypothetical protein
MWTVKCAHDAAKIQKVFGNKKKKGKNKEIFCIYSRRHFNKPLHFELKK